METYDCILIPGGGLTPEGELPLWTIARLEHAITYKEQFRWIAFLSGGTVHKPPPIDDRGYPVFESHKAAEYLVGSGLNPGQILTEICSYDTIGNAYYSRLLFTEPLQLKKLLIITSDFHMPRTREIFEWIFHLPPLTFEYQLKFEKSPNEGLSPSTLAARVQRENRSLKKLHLTRQNITSLEKLHTWLYTEHSAYAIGKKNEPLSEDELRSY